MSQVIHTHIVQIAQKLSLSLAAAIAALDPIELCPNQDAPFAERLCRAIAGQQLSVKAAASIWRRVVEQSEPQSLIEVIAQAEPETLRACGLSAAKVKAIGAIAVAAVEGELDAAELEQMTAGDRAQRLTQFWGVGQWTADMMNIFYFGEPDIWPEGDSAARKTLERLTHSQSNTQDTAAHFAPYRSYLALYLWRYADTTPD